MDAPSPFRPAVMVLSLRALTLFFFVSEREEIVRTLNAVTSRPEPRGREERFSFFSKAASLFLWKFKKGHDCLCGYYSVVRQKTLSSIDTILLNGARI